MQALIGHFIHSLSNNFIFNQFVWNEPKMEWDLIPYPCSYHVPVSIRLIFNSKAAPSRSLSFGTSSKLISPIASMVMFDLFSSMAVTNIFFFSCRDLGTFLTPVDSVVYAPWNGSSILARLLKAEDNMDKIIHPVLTIDMSLALKPPEEDTMISSFLQNLYSCPFLLRDIFIMQDWFVYLLSLNYILFFSPN